MSEGESLNQPIGSRSLQPQTGMRVAVITPYCRESLEMIRQCHDSVARQVHPCLHVMVADGFPLRELDGWPVDHVVLPRAHGDVGSTPRLVGCWHAIGLGVDAVAFLDADNWYDPDHVASLARLHDESGAPFLASSRMLCRLDGSVMGPCPNVNPETFIDTNCMMMTRGAFPVLSEWGLMAAYGHLIGDRIMLHHVRRAGVKRAFSGRPTVFYRCGKEGLYRQLNEPVPPGVEPRPDYERAFRLWVEDGNPPLDPPQKNANIVSAPRPALAQNDRSSEPASLFILGSGRSGTSMVAGLFRDGPHFIFEQSYPPRDSNPLGFFEDREVNAINEDILRPLLPQRDRREGPAYGMDSPGDGQRWLARLPVDAQVVASENLRQRIRAAVGRRPFCFKDPRFCYTLDAWRNEAPAARFVCVFRHPAEVVASMLKETRTAPYLRDLAFSVAQGFEVWRMMYRHVLTRHRRHGDWLFVHYEQIFQPETLDRLEAFVGASVDRAFPTPLLKRSRNELPLDAATVEILDELMALAR
jgi:hypothetical protein